MQKKAAKFAHHTNSPNWETLASCRKLSRICALFKAYSGERAWKPITFCTCCKILICLVCFVASFKLSLCNCCWLTVCIVVVVLCVLLSYVYLLYYVCIAVFTLDAGLLARSQYSEGPATGHLDTGFSCFPCA